MSNLVTASRYHDFSAGHRVVGHEGKCSFLHGHNYRVHFFCKAKSLDSVGRVLDFSEIKLKLCNWLEEHWDHRFLAWDRDDFCRHLSIIKTHQTHGKTWRDSVVWLPFNPTAENMGDYLLHTIGPQQLYGTGVRLVKVVVEETRKCSVTCEIKQ